MNADVRGGIRRFAVGALLALKRHWRRLNTGEMPLMRRPAENEAVFSMPVRRERKRWVHVVLFIATFITTTLAGMTGGDTVSAMIVSGLPYSVTLMMILAAHEFGHYFAAGRFGIMATLPYFIPLAIFIPRCRLWDLGPVSYGVQDLGTIGLGALGILVTGFGTMGAVIKIKSPVPHRKALFYVGAAGPLAGFAVSLVVFIIGIYLSGVRALPQELAALQSPLLLGDSLLVKGIVRLVHGVVPPGSEVSLHPCALAGWIGFFITAINLMPVGQLDGGHILYALIGKGQVVAGWAMVALLCVLSFFFTGWILWIVISFLFLMIAHPPVQEGPQLTMGEKITGWCCMAIFVLTFVPIPFVMGE